MKQLNIEEIIEKLFGMEAYQTIWWGPFHRVDNVEVSGGTRGLREAAQAIVYDIISGTIFLSRLRMSVALE